MSIDSDVSVKAYEIVLANIQAIFSQIYNVPRNRNIGINEGNLKEMETELLDGVKIHQKEMSELEFDSYYMFYDLAILLYSLKNLLSEKIIYSINEEESAVAISEYIANLWDFIFNNGLQVLFEQLEAELSLEIGNRLSDPDDEIELKNACISSLFLGFLKMDVRKRLPGYIIEFSSYDILLVMNSEATLLEEFSSFQTLKAFMDEYAEPYKALQKKVKSVSETLQQKQEIMLIPEAVTLPEESKTSLSLVVDSANKTIEMKRIKELPITDVPSQTKKKPLSLKVESKKKVSKQTHFTKEKVLDSDTLKDITASIPKKKKQVPMVTKPDLLAENKALKAEVAELKASEQKIKLEYSKGMHQNTSLNTKFLVLQNRTEKTSNDLKLRNDLVKDQKQEIDDLRKKLKKSEPNITIASEVATLNRLLKRLQGQNQVLSMEKKQFQGKLSNQNMLLDKLTKELSELKEKASASKLNVVQPISTQLTLLPDTKPHGFDGYLEVLMQESEEKVEELQDILKGLQPQVSKYEMAQVNVSDLLYTINEYIVKILLKLPSGSSLKGNVRRSNEELSDYCTALIENHFSSYHVCETYYHNQIAALEKYMAALDSVYLGIQSEASLVPLSTPEDFKCPSLMELVTIFNSKLDERVHIQLDYSNLNDNSNKTVK